MGARVVFHLPFHTSLPFYSGCVFFFLKAKLAGSTQFVRTFSSCPFTASAYSFLASPLIEHLLPCNMYRTPCHTKSAAVPHLEVCWCGTFPCSVCDIELTSTCVHPLSSPSRALTTPSGLPTRCLVDFAYALVRGQVVSVAAYTPIYCVDVSIPLTKLRYPCTYICSLASSL